MADNSLIEDKVDVRLVHEDWNGLVELIEESGMTRKKEALDIINRVGIFEGREKVLMELERGEVFNIIKKNFLPKLRRVELTIHFTQTEKN